MLRHDASLYGAGEHACGAPCAAAAVMLALLLAGCNEWHGAGGEGASRDASAATSFEALRADSAPSVGSAAAPSSSGPRFVPGSASGDLAAAVARAIGEASRQGRTVVVYVGATWCEPCQRFHQAVEQGELAHVEPLARVTFLEFDLDRDRERLTSSAYVSKYIPLFALPGPDGRGSGKQAEGGIKGDGAVAYMVPRLTALLAL